MGATAIRMLLVGPPGTAFHEAAAFARDAGAEVAMADTVEDALILLRRTGAGMVMIDVSSDVVAFLGQLAIERFAVPVFACGIDAPADRAVAAIRAGARDYVPLPPDRALIAAAINQIATPANPVLIGHDSAFERCLAFARAMGGAHAPLLIEGEPGTGKESVARAAHAAGGGMPFIALECAGLSADVIESEIFGHGAGEIEGVPHARRGAMANAAGGTLYLRDVDCLPASVQARLLTALGEAHGPRMIAGTVRDLRELVERGRFRADLLARFALATIPVPPLRERGDDIAMLAHSFVQRFAALEGRAAPVLTVETLALLKSYDWPGNVTELHDAMHRAILLCETAEIAPHAIVLADGSRLPERVASGTSADVEGLVGRTVEEVERELILQTLQRCRGNRTSASQILGISVRTMRNKLKTFVEAGIAVAPAG